jgi:hypothetical protein
MFSPEKQDRTIVHAIRLPKATASGPALARSVKQGDDSPLSAPAMGAHRHLWDNGHGYVKSIRGKTWPCTPHSGSDAANPGACRRLACDLRSVCLAGDAAAQHRYCRQGGAGNFPGSRSPARVHPDHGGLLAP